jgi:UDP-glucose 4-epimerase
MSPPKELISPFITGGAGFIGNHLVARLLAEGCPVTAYDNLSSGKREWIEEHLGNSRFRFIQADLLDLDALKEAMKGHDVIFHLGANTDIPKGNETADLDLKNCTIATYNVLEAMRANDINKILFASSSTVFGEVSMLPTPESIGPVLPISLYGAGKLACEGLISAYCHLFGMQAWIFRFANVLGSRMGHGVVYDFIAKLKRNPHELEIMGDGYQRKAFFLVEDCIDGMFTAYRRANNGCNLFNLGYESASRVDDIARIVAEEMGLEKVHFKHTGGRRGWPGDVPQVELDITAIRKLGWQPRHTSDEAVRIAARRLLGKE